jgi:hypothetical protein
MDRAPATAPTKRGSHERWPPPDAAIVISNDMVVDRVPTWPIWCRHVEVLRRLDEGRFRILP